MRADELARLLPGVYRRTLRREGTGAGSVRGGDATAEAVGGGESAPSPLAALLAAMEGLHAPCETVLAELDRYFDPRRAPEEFVAFLARWVDLERYLPERSRPGADPLPGGTGRLRELVAEAATLSRWRGTGRGLVRFLEIATGVGGFTIEEAVTGPDGHPRPFHVRVRLPAGAAAQERLVRRIVEGEKPAYVTYELAIEPRGAAAPPLPGTAERKGKGASGGARRSRKDRDTPQPAPADGADDKEG